MAKIRVSEGQSLLDVALWQLGSVEAAYALALANGLAVTDALQAGQLLEVPASAVLRPDLVSYFQSIGHTINTGDLPGANDEPAPGPLDHHKLDYSEEDFA
ncbi:hypothetical protein [Hymenobacter sp. B81]|uniref:hypothetical protein n=1 Tax=Hymenobacter sp. B81 TaxID=3344878 RepID=UPI0037DD745E